MTLDTVDIDTPEILATSLIVTGIFIPPIFNKSKKFTFSKIKNTHDYFFRCNYTTRKDFFQYKKRLLFDILRFQNLSENIYLIFNADNKKLLNFLHFFTDNMLFFYEFYVAN